jgi:hypothetical protein
MSERVKLNPWRRPSEVDPRAETLAAARRRLWRGMAGDPVPGEEPPSGRSFAEVEGAALAQAARHNASKYERPRAPQPETPTVPESTGEWSDEAYSRFLAEHGLPPDDPDDNYEDEDEEKDWA